MTLTRQLPRDVEGRHLPLLRHELRAILRADPDLDLDCSNVGAPSPAGQALLLYLDRAARHRGGRLHLNQPSHAITLALQSTGLSHRLTQRQHHDRQPHPELTVRLVWSARW